MDSKTLLFAIGASVNPTLLVIVLYMLAQSRPRALLAVYLFGGFLISIGLGLAVVFGLSGVKGLQDSGSTTNSGIDVTVGFILLIVAVIVGSGRYEQRRDRIRERHQQKHPEKTHNHPSLKDHLRPVLPTAFFLGVVTSLPGACYLIGLKNIISKDLGPVESVVVILLFNVIMFSWGEIPLLVYILRPEQTVSILQRFQAWIARNSRVIVTGVATFYGIYLLANALPKL